MNEIKCSIPDCQEIFKTEESISLVARYMCRWHSRRDQLLAINRSVTEDDFRDREIRFQEYQFDPDLARGGNPRVDPVEETDDISDKGDL